MWIVELNVAGRKFVHYVPSPRPRFTLSARAFAWRPALHRPTSAA